MICRVFRKIQFLFSFQREKRKSNRPRNKLMSSDGSFAEVMPARPCFGTGPSKRAHKNKNLCTEYEM